MDFPKGAKRLINSTNIFDLINELFSSSDACLDYN